MTFTRMVFAFALFMLILGILASRVLAGMLFPVPPAEPQVIAAANTPRPATPHHVSPIHHARNAHTTTPKAPLAQPRATPTPTPTALTTPTSTVTPLPSPTVTATTGIVTLTRYWVGTPQVSPGATIAVGYVIDNGTGQTQHLLLGASIKPSRDLNWASSSISDPFHDVVATIPPGISMHTRYFTLPARLRAGSYDVAWGLRDDATGARTALVTAAGALQVVG